MVQQYHTILLNHDDTWLSIMVFLLGLCSSYPNREEPRYLNIPLTVTIILI